MAGLVFIRTKAIQANWSNCRHEREAYRFATEALPIELGHMYRLGSFSRATTCQCLIMSANDTGLYHISIVLEVVVCIFRENA